MSDSEIALDQSVVTSLQAQRRRQVSSAQALRSLPIRWRVLSIALLNILVAFMVAAVIWEGAQVLTAARNDLRQTRESDRLLAQLESEANRLQNLIHRYFTQPNPELLDEITKLRESLMGRLKNRASADPILSGSTAELMQATERLIAGFSELRNVQGTIASTYDSQVLRPTQEMSGLYAIVEGATRDRNALIWPALSKSRDSFSTTLVLTNSFYSNPSREAADDLTKNLETIEGAIPVMMDLSDNDLQRGALGALGYRVVAWRLGIAQLQQSFSNRARLLHDAIDGNQVAMANAIDRLSENMRARERSAYERFERTLADEYLVIGVVAVLTLSLSIFIGLGIAQSIVTPLRVLMDTMSSVVAGDYTRPVRDVTAQDEIGEMARAVEVFRENAIAKRQAEIELKASKEHAETALKELQNTQQSLIQAEKLAALGGLVAGVAHEVNNPIGISLTVASSFERRCTQFAKDVQDGALRRSKLDEFVGGCQEAAKQLVANLNRAAELIQSFKQVAVDRSHAERRIFDLQEATEQIVASVRPALKRSAVSLEVEVPEKIVMDSYPGPYGQVLTNLVLNALTHAFPDNRAGTMRLSVRRQGSTYIEVRFQDDGIGMSADVQNRAFEPFFTTKRSRGGTGLGLHIVYNLVTRRLGGRLHLESQPGYGTVFKILLPIIAPKDEPAEAAAPLASVEPT